jgi:hypothetical protein
MRPMIIAFRVTEFEKKLVERKTLRLGCSSQSDFLRLAVRLVDADETDPAGKRSNKESK